MHHFWKKAD